MKIKFLTLIAAFLGIVSISKAQLFIGGSVGYNTTGGKNEYTPKTGASKETDLTKTRSLELSPKIGYEINDKFSAGLGFVIGSEKVKADDDNYNKTTTIGFAPFLRYYAFKKNNFGIFAEATLGLNSANEKNTIAGSTTDGDKIFTKYFNIAPCISYTLSDKFELEAAINVLKLSYVSKTTKSETPAGSDNENKTTNNSFNFGVDADNICTSGFLTIGFIYKL